MKHPLSAAVLLFRVATANAGPKGAALLEPVQDDAPALWRMPLPGRAAR